MLHYNFQWLALVYCKVYTSFSGEGQPSCVCVLHFIFQWRSALVCLHATLHFLVEVSHHVFACYTSFSSESQPSCVCMLRCNFWWRFFLPPLLTQSTLRLFDTNNSFGCIFGNLHISCHVQFIRWPLQPMCLHLWLQLSLKSSLAYCACLTVFPGGGPPFVCLHDLLQFLVKGPCVFACLTMSPGGEPPFACLHVILKFLVKSSPLRVCTS